MATWHDAPSTLLISRKKQHTSFTHFLAELFINYQDSFSVSSSVPYVSCPVLVHYITVKDINEDPITGLIKITITHFNSRH